MSLTLNKRENKPIMYLMSAYKFFVKDWERNKESQRKKIEVIHDRISHKDVQNCLWLWVLSQLVRCFPSQNRLLKEIMGQSRQCRLKLFIVIFPLMTTSLTCFCKLTHIHQLPYSFRDIPLHIAIWHNEQFWLLLQILKQHNKLMNVWNSGLNKIYILMCHVSVSVGNM